MSPRAPLLVLAVGNPSRGDDAAGPWLAERLSQWLDHDGAAWHDRVDVICDMQLMIEHVLDLSGRQQVLIVDAAAQGAAPVVLQPIVATHSSPSTSHQCTPQHLLALHQEVLGHPAPPADLLSVVGHDFELGSPLSTNMRKALDDAWHRIEHWVRTCLPLAHA
jgi:hydrogenase maturation protease